MMTLLPVKENVVLQLFGSTKSLKSFFVHYISELEKSTDRTIIPSVTFAFEVVVLAQLAVRSITIPEVRGLDPVIANFYNEQIYY